MFQDFNFSLGSAGEKRCVLQAEGEQNRAEAIRLARQRHRLR
jgi:hypothetical protein